MRYEVIREDDAGRTGCALPIAPAAGDVLVLDYPTLSGRFVVSRRQIDPRRGSVKVIVREAPTKGGS